MCFDPDSHPPIAPIRGAAVEELALDLEAHDGNRFMAFAGLAEAPSATGILVFPDNRGLHHFYEELCLRLAEMGFDALAFDYYARTAETRDRTDGFAYQEHVVRTTWAGNKADVRAAAGWLRSEREIRTLFSLGFCYGGRLSFLSGTLEDLELAGVVGFYGPPTGKGRNDAPAPADVAGQMSCPVLGLFGGADQGIPAGAVGQFEAALTAAGVRHELVTYPDAPHSFFDRKQADFAAESADAWKRVLRFVRAEIA